MTPAVNVFPSGPAEPVITASDTVQPLSQSVAPVVEVVIPDIGGTRIRTAMSSRADEPSDISWGVSNLDAADLGELRDALHEHFRRTAVEPVSDADAIAGRVRRLERINELVQAVEAVSSFHDSRIATTDHAALEPGHSDVVTDEPSRGLGGHRVIHGRGLGALLEPYPEERQANGWA